MHKNEQETKRSKAKQVMKIKSKKEGRRERRKDQNQKENQERTQKPTTEKLYNDGTPYKPQGFGNRSLSLPLLLLLLQQCPGVALCRI